MFITEHIATILWVTGLITAAPFLQFLAPKLALKLLYHLDPPSDATGAFFSRHWGMVVESAADQRHAAGRGLRLHVFGDL